MVLQELPPNIGRRQESCSGKKNRRTSPKPLSRLKETNGILIGDTRTKAFGQKENMGKGEYGKGTFRADQFCILGTYGQWLGRVW